MKGIDTDSVSKSILKTLLYFDVFNYPLKADEVYHFLQSNHVTPELIQNKLKQLSENGVTFHFNKFYSIQNNKALVDRRVKGNNEATKSMKLAQKQASFIHKFPFVSAVMASGSLSKGYMDDSCDLDFFIITRPQRLWIARTLLVLYKRIFLGNNHKFFCVNYFVDESNLAIEEQNLYTATELVTLLPLTGIDHHKKLLKANPWVLDYLPNAKGQTGTTQKSSGQNKLKTALERLINLTFPGALNSLLMKLTLKRWKKLYFNKYAVHDFEIAFKTKPDVSKNHPNYYQKKVMELYTAKTSQFGIQNNLNWKS